MVKTDRNHSSSRMWADVGHRLRVARIALGITEQEAADVFGVMLQTYRRYEAGGPQRATGFVDFAAHYGVSIDWLILGDGTRLGHHLRMGSKVAILPRAP